MKRFLSLSLSLLFGISLIGSTPVSAATGTSGCFRWQDNGTEVAIQYSTACTGAVSIPATISGLPVTSISGTISSAGLTSISIPSSVTVIVNDAFLNAPLLSEIIVDSNNANYSSESGVLFNKSKSSLIRYPAKKVGDVYTIPSSVTTVSVSSFSASTLVRQVNVPTSVQSFGECSFCSSSITSVSFDAGSQLSSIGRNAFMYANELSTFTIPASTTSIGVGAFYGASSLSSVSFENGSLLTTIGSEAFSLANSLTSFTVPRNVSTIGTWAFTWASALESINVDNSNSFYASESGVLFNKSKTTLITYPFGNRSSVYVVPDGVTTISDSAFRDNTNLNRVVFPNSLTTILDFAFNGATSLTTVTIPNGVTRISYSAFSGATSMRTIYFLGEAPINIGQYAFTGIGANPRVYVRPFSAGFSAAGTTWNTMLVTYGYALTYDENGASSGVAPKDPSALYAAGAPVTILGNSGSLVKSGYSFGGWNTEPDGSGVSYSSSSPFTMGSLEAILYAKWNPITYTVAYDSKGGSTVNAGTFITSGSIGSAPIQPTKVGHTFAGWSATDGGSAITFPYRPGVTSDITMYARWTLNPAPVALPAPMVVPAAPAPAAPAQPIMRPKQKTPSKALATQIGMTVTPKAKVKLKVAKASKKICKVSGSKLVALKPGNCSVTVSVTPKKTKQVKKPKTTKKSTIVAIF